jgi:ammonia channel protein AmtB
MMVMMMMMMMMMVIIIIIIICYQLFKYVFTFRSVNSFTLYSYPNHCDIHSDTHTH